MDSKPKRRYQKVAKEKSDGATYTPQLLADFVATQIINAGIVPDNDILNIFDPAIGDGQLLDSLLERIPQKANQTIHVYGYDTNLEAINNATATLSRKHPNAVLHLQHEDFLSHVLECYETSSQTSLFGQNSLLKYDIIIANPPYVRTQILGADRAKILAREFGLEGRIDLYYAFIIGMAKVLKPKGVAGIIVSNRFMTTKSGGSARKAILDGFNLMKVWDFGDTKLFEAAVLPAVLLAHGSNGAVHYEPVFTSIYQCTEKPEVQAANPIEALTTDGIVGLDDGRAFKVQHGTLDSGPMHDSVWRIATTTNDAWLDTVKAHTWKMFGDVGKIRVGVKTTADKVFIRSDWEAATGGHIPELLRPLITHHVARSFRALPPKKDTKILYPHEVVNGNRRCIDITRHPNSEKYLLEHKTALEGRKYVIEAGRKWYEIWVPQDPAAWNYPKLVFRDISEKPTFWVDDSGGVVNGDCYWLVVEGKNTDLVWLAAAVANSTFIESFYDYSFNNKLYAGRRRFITQYVEKFPLPAHDTPLSTEIIALAKRIHEEIDTADATGLVKQLNAMVWQAFGLVEEVTG
ncbi:N-6 DNA methylase [Oryzomonas japonica]|uniref:site-specific DNA-methyltransferase (adenine-specific) n=1 Tax=Oryzomonas japonica TaxID=2603858 RepID=A0A7J4ZVS7_9BACT|nr:N-6 DNA methylase [Oryzomonas japonica]KAB0667521.1 N-6 DNA methylase [Oryzomonas japonica]